MPSHFVGKRWWQELDSNQVSLREADGVVVKPGDDRIFVLASDLASVGVPKMGDTFTSATSGTVWTVVACEVSPGGTLYPVFGRRG